MNNQGNNKLYTVENYLNLLNLCLGKYRARVQGEISSLDIRPGYLFFSLKDGQNESLLNCFMWRNDYQLCGLKIEEGKEIIVQGFPELYKPRGRLTFRTQAIELVGEGALKRAYDELKRRLEKQGLFDLKQKKVIPELPQKIGLITSRTGAVVHDFLNNLGRYGYKIKFLHSKVEGQLAVKDLICAIDYFNNQNIDVLVIIRGGGSFESLQAFNNEALARKIFEFKAPIICGIGHDKDIPLASLAADQAVSTPTAVAVMLNRSWEKAIDNVISCEKDLLSRYQKLLTDSKHSIEILSNQLKQRLSIVFKKFGELKYGLKAALISIEYLIKDSKKTLKNFPTLILGNLKKCLERDKDILDNIEKKLKIFNPLRQLRLGYSLVFLSGKIVKSIKMVRIGQDIDIKVNDGKIKSKIKDINRDVVQ